MKSRAGACPSTSGFTRLRGSNSMAGHEGIDWKAMYDVLALDPGASEEDIKKRYRHLCKVYHPDAGTAKDDSAFKRINEAHARLTDPSNASLLANWLEDYFKSQRPPHLRFLEERVSLGPVFIGETCRIDLHIVNDGGAATGTADVGTRPHNDWIDLSADLAVDDGDVLLTISVTIRPTLSARRGPQSVEVYATLGLTTARCQLSLDILDEIDVASARAGASAFVGDSSSTSPPPPPGAATFSATAPPLVPVARHWASRSIGALGIVVALILGLQFLRITSRERAIKADVARVALEASSNAAALAAEGERRRRANGIVEHRRVERDVVGRWTGQFPNTGACSGKGAPRDAPSTHLDVNHDGNTFRATLLLRQFDVILGYQCGVVRVVYNGSLVDVPRRDADSTYLLLTPVSQTGDAGWRNAEFYRPLYIVPGGERMLVTWTASSARVRFRPASDSENSRADSLVGWFNGFPVEPVEFVPQSDMRLYEAVGDRTWDDLRLSEVRTMELRLHYEGPVIPAHGTQYHRIIISGPNFRLRKAWMRW